MTNKQCNNVNTHQEHESAERKLDHLEGKQWEVAERKGDGRPEGKPTGRPKEVSCRYGERLEQSTEEAG